MRLPMNTVKLHNIDDAVGFTIDALRRSGIPAFDHEREDLIADGLAILCDWADRWKPENYGDGTGSFAGYCHTYLPMRLKDAWHRLHPEHAYKTQPDGTRRYEFGDAPLSIDYEMPHREGPDREPVTFADLLVGSTFHPDPHETCLPERVLAALPDDPNAEQVLTHLHHGYTARETARKVGVTVTQVTRIRSSVGSALAHPTAA